MNSPRIFPRKIQKNNFAVKRKPKTCPQKLTNIPLPQKIF